jgi:hypothetical protein
LCDAILGCVHEISHDIKGDLAHQSLASEIMTLLFYDNYDHYVVLSSYLLKHYRFCRYPSDCNVSCAALHDAAQLPSRSDEEMLSVFRGNKHTFDWG